jgi:SAM-dependent methyltransferase
LVIPLLHAIPTPLIAAGCGLPPLLALAQYGVRWRVGAGIGIVAALLFSPLFQVTRTKSYDENFVSPIYEKWTPIARLTLFDEKFDVLNRQERGFTWGRGTRAPRGVPIAQYWLEQDASAGTPITKFTGDLRQVAHLMFDVTTLGYQIRPPQRVVIIGSGGGRDILTALISGANDVHAVELNRHTIETVSDRYGEFSGNIYRRPGVRAIEREGRSYLTHSDEQFDLIQISLIDSWAASAAGAFALAENNLYTVEAFELYLKRLSPGGLLSTSRWMNEIPRLIVLSRAALARAGFEHPERHLLMASAGRVATVLLSKQAFSPADIARLRKVSDQRGFRIHYPVIAGKAVDLAIKDFVDGDYQRLSREGLNVEPPTDDSPYFFHVVSPFADAEILDRDAFSVTEYDVNWSSTIVLRRVKTVVSGLAIALFMLPFLVESVFRRGRGSIVLLRATLFFAAIGAAFMLLENTLVQHFVLYLGHTSYAVTVVIASLLLGMGVGSIFAESVGVAPLQRLGWMVPTIVVAVVLALPALFETTLGLPLAARIGVSSAILLPLGAALGLFFPLGMLRFGDANKPWFWAINGAFGVVASVMSLALSMEFGFQLVGQLSAGIYGLAWICLRETT